MKPKFIGLLFLSAIAMALTVHTACARKSKPATAYKLTIGEDQELTFPGDMKECKVFDSNTLEKAVLQATWLGECEWIVLRPGSDFDPKAPFAIQLDKPLLIQDMNESAEGHPLVITNDTGRPMIFKAPKNGGCAIILKKPDVAIMGFTFEGAICQ